MPSTSKFYPLNSFIKILSIEFILQYIAGRC